MSAIINATTPPITIAVGGTALLFVVNPYILYGTMAAVVIACAFICIQIIWNCEKRIKKLDAIASRTQRRALANGCKCNGAGSDKSSPHSN